MQNLDVAPNTMQLVIHSIRDVPYKGDADRAINAFVKFDFGYPQSAPIRDKLLLWQEKVVWHHLMRISRWPQIREIILESNIETL